MSYEKINFQNGTEKLSDAFYCLGLFSFCFMISDFEPELARYWPQLTSRRKQSEVNEYQSSSEALEKSQMNQKNYRSQIRRVQNDLDRVLAEYKSIKERFWTFDKYLSWILKSAGWILLKVRKYQSVLISHFISTNLVLSKVIFLYIFENMADTEQLLKVMLETSWSS